MDPLSLARRLIAIPSVNPMGAGEIGPECYETRVTAELVRLFHEQNVPCEVQDVAPGRGNVLAAFAPHPERPCMLWDAHQDTVPVGGMTIAPFDPVVRHGRLLGRGACDVKGGLAAMLAAFFRLVRERPPNAANVVLCCSCDEEATQQGVLKLVRLWQDRTGVSRLLSRRPAMAVVAEPTGLDVVVAHRGATRWTFRTAGRACHSSDPSQGVNAIYRMAAVVQSLEAYAGSLADRPAHPLCGPATLSVGMIRGGRSVNTVPDTCEIEIDRRSIPGEEPQAVRQEAIDFVRERISHAVEALPAWIAAPPLSDMDNGPLAAMLLSAIESVVGTRQLRGVAYGTNASTIACAGVPAVVFGPGSINQAHTADEWLPIDELEAAAEVLFRFAIQK